MKKILQSPTARARLGRSPHDLSKRVTYSSAPGMLLPVLFDFLSPGDYIDINEFLFTRTQPFKTAAFIRCNQYVDYFFVPMEQIDPYFGNSFFGIDDVGNTNDVVMLNAPFDGDQQYTLPYVRPYFVAGTFHSAVMNSSLLSCKYDSSANTYDVYCSAVSCDEYGIPMYFGALRLMDMLQYGSFWFDHCGDAYSENQQTYQSSASDAWLNTYLLNVYQKIFYDYYRRSDYTPNNAFAYNLGYAYKNKSLNEGIDSTSSSASFLVGESYNGMFKLRYHPLKRDFFTNIQPSPLFDPTSSVAGYASRQGTQKPALNDVNSAVLSSYGVNVSELSNILGSDYDTTLEYTMPQKSLEDDVNNNYSQFGPFDLKSSAVSANSLRFMYAYEKMLMITQRGGRHYDSQVAAHFGVKVPQGVSGEVYYLGGHVSKLSIGEVIATSAGSDGSSTSSLGEIAGRGLGVSNKNKHIKFKAPCHGFLMVIQSTVPEVDYKDYGCNRINRWMSINDFPHPEFDHIGMQPLYYWQANFGFIHNYKNMDANIITGWQYRNSELKLSYDIVHGAFNETLQDWTSASVFGINKSFVSDSPQALLSDNNPPYLTAYSMYCNPCYLDNVFALSFAPPVINDSTKTGFPSAFLISSTEKYNDNIDPAVGEDYPTSRSILYSRDPFLNYIDFQYHKSSWMSTYSMPRL